VQTTATERQKIEIPGERVKAAFERVVGKFSENTLLRLTSAQIVESSGPKLVLLLPSNVDWSKEKPWTGKVVIVGEEAS